ncbi:sulfate transporter family protein [Coccidioides immitis RMSCC 2394]|uniref:Sulfate transporter family protein n=1 Tax=Coccidioides immitis RMSCC 2394 TaxID=404692 RepID=A0A0J6Y6B5_COCIT|nr:sulfate transporter family protein [Coccidioides immitis RMSCC 2394]
MEGGRSPGPGSGGREESSQALPNRRRAYSTRDTRDDRLWSSEAPARTSSDAAGTESLRSWSRRPSVSERTPARSFFHRAFHGPLEDGQYSFQGVREQTTELESRAISDAESIRSVTTTFSGNGDSVPLSLDQRILEPFRSRDRAESHISQPEVIVEEESGSDTPRAGSAHSGGSALTALLRPPQQEQQRVDSDIQDDILGEDGHDAAEETPLVRQESRARSPRQYGTLGDAENPLLLLPTSTPPWDAKSSPPTKKIQWRNFCDPRRWDRRTILQKGIIYPASLLPAVLLGLLLNVLDALSYGMILFPLGEPLFADRGADGISMFYISTIISQLVYSCGGSIFKGGIGSEMIEVVPFFHKMALMTLARVGADNMDSVLATTILAYALSSILTGTVFFIMGATGLGSFIGFFPRHILIGCIGGVGWFLVATGVEVSARLSGNFKYDLDTLERLFQLDTIFLWTTPLLLAIGLLVVKRYIKSNFLVGGYFLSVACLFYFFELVLGIPLDTLREKGWVFEAPASDNPWYHFYTLYNFSAVNWPALADTIPAMFALTFFGILHVPINVPALGISTGEDNLNVDRELIAHGISNALSGFAGSIQNYLVYTNSLLFIASGGNHRLAGIMLAIATFGILLAGPGLIGFIPIMVVGALIYMLGIELMEEALVDTWGRLHRLEYMTVMIIVVTMGAWDFVTGIVVGIFLACLNFVVQASQKSAITGTYTGQVAVSTVRRNPTHAKFLKEAGRQTFVIKLSGFLFFGTIVSVEKQVRWLIEGEVFSHRPIRFLVLDLLHVKGLDFSAAEAFTRLNRMLQTRRVHMIICGVDISGEVGRSLRNVGLFEQENEVPVLENLNSALEYCENELLQALHDRKNAMSGIARTEPSSLKPIFKPQTSDLPVNSPRNLYLHQLAATTLREESASTAATASSSTPTSKPTSTKPQHQPPLSLLMHTFQGLTTQPEAFWAPAAAYFTRAEYLASSILYRMGEQAQHFFLLESGMLRAEYDTPQGNYFELIAAGRPCGELPFFGATRRTATVRAETPCVVWMMGEEGWRRLRERDADVGLEMMRVCLKLTAERMHTITSYVLTATR